MRPGTLIFFSGKMGAGKSTRAAEVAKDRNAVLLSEDEWLGALYPDKISSLDDYIKYSGRLRPQMQKLVQSILSAGTDVVMDFPANTLTQRAWFRKIFESLDAPHRLVFVDVPDDVCLRQIEQRRRERPERAVTDTVEMFQRVTKYFVEPTSQEGFDILRVTTSA